eukprot:c5130_g1_i1.p1 GENE.c5130_g1_i1~~c5130_g1_i1.p1  ORF type:complete len:326 (-),score=53.32 c5130_g1_i1:250-1227(-)
MGCGSNMPSVSDLFRHAPRRVIGAWIVSAILSAIGLALTIRYVARVKKTQPPSRRSDLYLDIVWVGFMFSATSALTMVFPRAYGLFDVLQTCFEAHIIYSFGMLFINLIAGDNIYDPHISQQRCLENLEHVPPKKHFATFPCCCWYPCVSRRSFDRPLVRTVVTCFRQYLVIGPLTSIVALWLDLESGSLTGKKTQNAYVIIRIVGTVSILVAVWALLILYKASHDQLLHFHMTSKFIAIKAMLIITALQEMVISSYIKKKGDHDSSKMFTTEFKAHFFMSFVVCIEGFIMTLLLIRAFPDRELDPGYGATIVAAEKHNRVDTTL